MNNELLKLKSSLCDVIEKWINDSEEKKEELWMELNTCICNETKELMTDAAFTVLLSQKNLTEYLRLNGELK